MSPEEERDLLRFLSSVETANMIASVLMVLTMLGACVLLDRNHRQITTLHVELQMRNQQGARALVLLQEQNEHNRLQAELMADALRRMEQPR
jgi:hypothetical protein